MEYDSMQCLNALVYMFIFGTQGSFYQFLRTQVKCQLTNCASFQVCESSIYSSIWSNCRECNRQDGTGLLHPFSQILSDLVILSLIRCCRPCLFGYHLSLRSRNVCLDLQLVTNVSLQRTYQLSIHNIKQSSFKQS